MCVRVLVFFKQKTAYEVRISDWSSDGCSSDLGHQHAGRDLVAVGDADHRVGAMGIDHIFDAVGDELARGQRIEHAAMAHGDAVIDGDGVELLGNTPRPFDLPRDELPEVLQMHMAGNELGEAVDHGDDRRSEEHTSELQSLMRNSYAVFCLQKKNKDVT